MQSKIESPVEYPIYGMSFEQMPSKLQLDRQYHNYLPLLFQCGETTYMYGLDIIGSTLVKIPYPLYAHRPNIHKALSSAKEPTTLRNLPDEMSWLYLISKELRAHIPEALNEMQKNIIRATLKFPLDDIVETTAKKPFLMIKALSSILVPPGAITKEDKEIFLKEDVWDSINLIRDLLFHPSPQDLLRLAIKNDDTAQPVTKEAVIGYIRRHVDMLIEEQKEKPSLLMHFKTMGQDKLIDLNICPYTMTLRELIELFFNELTKHSEYLIEKNPYTERDKLLPTDFQFFYLGQQFNLNDHTDLHLTFFEYLQKYHNSHLIENECDIDASYSLMVQGRSSPINEYVRILPANIAKNCRDLFNACHAPKAHTIDIEQVKSLLAGGADPNFTVHCDLFPSASASKNFAFSPLHVISGKTNSVEVAELLIAHGAKLNQVDGCIGNTPLLTAIARCDENLAKFLITKIQASNDPAIKLVLDQKDTGRECQNTPLVLALKKRMDEVALLLIQAGANPNITCRSGETALHWACMLRKNDIISALLKSGANKTVVNQFGRTAYEYYVYPLRLFDVAQPLQKDYSRDKTYLPELSDLWFHVSEYYTDERYPQFKILVDSRNSRPVDLQLAEKIMASGTANTTLEEQHKNLVERKYTDLYEQEKQFGEVCFFAADGRNKAEFLSKVVCEMTAERKQERFKNAELSLAVKERNKTKIEELLILANKTSVNASSSDGFTALHWAAMQRNDELIKKLIAIGADPTIKNKHGRTPMDYYQYQMRKADFEKSMSDWSYKELSQWAPELAMGSAKMPEFDEVFPMPIFAGKRNCQPIDSSIFGPNFPLNQVIEEKTEVKMGPSASSTSSSYTQPKTSVDRPSKIPAKKQHQLALMILANSSALAPASSPTFSSVLSQPTIAPINQTSITLHPDLKNALDDGGVRYNYIKSGITTLENLIALHQKTPWAITALRCSNIREAITNKHITLDDLALLTEEQTKHVQHKYQADKLVSKIKEFIAYNKSTTAKLC